MGIRLALRCTSILYAVKGVWKSRIKFPRRFVHYFFSTDAKGTF